MLFCRLLYDMCGYVHDKTTTFDGHHERSGNDNIDAAKSQGEPIVQPVYLCCGE